MDHMLVLGVVYLGFARIYARIKCFSGLCNWCHVA